MSMKDAIFGTAAPSSHGGATYRDSIQAWLPVKNIIGGVVITKDNRFIKILEVLPVNFYLKSPSDQQVYDRGFRTFLCGMARGCDQYFAEAVLACRAAGTAPEAILTAMVPCPSQKDGWAAEEQARYDALLAACSAVEVLEPVYTPGCMLRRNRAMVQRASLLISVFDGTPGGTASTLRFAAKQGIEILPLWM